jgi:hypothetical protein
MNTTPYRLTLAASAVAAALAVPTPAEARVTRIVIDQTQALTGQSVPYETITGRAFGELDPHEFQNSEITDLNKAKRNAKGKVEYISSFFLVKPVDMSQSSGLLWHDVHNRGGRITISADLRNSRDVGLSSAWQGDNAGATAVPANADSLTPVAPSANEWVKTPVVTGVTGNIIGRIINRSGLDAAPLNVMGNPIPYFPADSANNAGAKLTVHLNETINGNITEGETIPNSDWKFCGGGTFAAPLPVTTLPVQVCMKNGFEATKLYQLRYKVKDPYVLGAGTAAFRDLGSFFRYASKDDFGNPNPLGSNIRWSIIRGSSQSGNFTRHYIFLGMNEDERGRIVHDGAWPLIAGRRVANNSRWGQPDGVLELYQMGSEGPQWWSPYEDHVRHLPTRGILDRCRRTDTCPKVVETFGGAEVFALKMTTSWVGTDAKKDIPLPSNVRRYYLPSSTHGGGGGGFNEAIADNAVNCPGNNWGRGVYRANPVPATQLVNRMRVALREWVMNGTPPPASQWPTLGRLEDVVNGGKDDRDDDHGHGHDGHGHGHDDHGHDGHHQGHHHHEPLLAEPNMRDMGFPAGIPGVPSSVFKPENFIFPVFDYDWGPDYDHSEANGVPTNAPPPIRHVIKMLVPKVTGDGNERGGVPTVLNDAPLGTYLGWNLTAGPNDGAKFDGRPFHAGQVCDYIGGMIPFAKTKAQRLAAIHPETGLPDPRPSLEERYGTHAGYVAAVKKAANNAACRGYLLVGPEAATDGSLPPQPSSTCAAKTAPVGFPNDWKVLVDQAIASNVCNQPGDNGKCNPAAP